MGIFDKDTKTTKTVDNLPDIKDVQVVSDEAGPVIAKADPSSVNKTPTDQLIMAAIRKAMLVDGKPHEGRVSIQAVDGNNIEVLSFLPNKKPVSCGVFQLV